MLSFSDIFQVKQRAVGLLFFAAMLMLAGCATRPVELTKIPGERRFNDGDMVPIKIDGVLASRTESLWGPFGEEKHFQVVTGDIWKRIFVGYDDSKPSLTVMSSKLQEAMAGAGFTIRYTYTVHAILHVQGHEVEIAGNGSRAAAVAVLSAMRQAVELAVVDVAHQARAIVKANGSALLLERTGRSQSVTQGSPNQALEPTRPTVTPRACARVAPAGRVAHLKR